MNFGPDWMRAAAGTTGTTEQPAVKPPVANHPAFRDPIRSLSGPSATSSLVDDLATELDAARISAPVAPREVIVAPEAPPLPPRQNPYRYSREDFLGWFETGKGLTFWQEAGLEVHEPIFAAEPLPPVMASPLNELEESILASGSVNSEQRRGGGGGGRREGGGNRSRTTSNARATREDKEEGFRKFMSRAQITDERPAWAAGLGAGSGSGAAPLYYPQEDPAETLWLYCDPQGNVQGPFTGADMHEWYRAGFFTAQLMVKRDLDADFIALGTLVQLLGNDEEPFLIPIPSATPAPGHVRQMSGGSAQAALLYEQAAALGMSVAEYEVYLAQATYGLDPSTAALWQQQQAASSAQPEVIDYQQHLEMERAKLRQQQAARGVHLPAATAGVPDDTSSWAKHGQPGPVPKSLKEI